MQIRKLLSPWTLVVIFGLLVLCLVAYIVTHPQSNAAAMMKRLFRRLIPLTWPWSPIVPPHPHSGRYRLDLDLTGDRIRPGSYEKALTYYTEGDPTRGHVQYGAWDDLITYENGRTVIRVGSPDTAVGDLRLRRSIRLFSQDMYNSGLFVISLDHMPEGNGTWPAFWLTAKEPAGSAWACNGEIDIIEGVNSVDSNSSTNQATLHTSDKDGAQCRQDGVPGIMQPNCADGWGDTCGCASNGPCPFNGCGVQVPHTFGYDVNRSGGGTYACELTESGQVTIWFFQNGSEPGDLQNNDPDPSSWPDANRVQFNPCPGSFNFLQIVINTTLCGEWAGNVYQPGGWPQCVEDVKTAPLEDAYWSINYIKAFSAAE